MDPAGFAKPPGKLVRTVQDAFAFVPNPLPRSLSALSLSERTINELARAENALGHLRGTTGRLLNPWLVGSPMLHREAILSSRIEGTNTTPEELVLFEAGGPPVEGPSRIEDTQEVANYVAAMRFGLQRLTTIPVCLRLIGELHARLLAGVRGEKERPGEFRTIQNWIGSPTESIGAARFVPPPVKEMQAALADFETYLNLPEDHRLPLLIHLALVHYQFETIHPFRDGNGRIGRLLIPLLLCSHARLDEPLLYLSSYFERNREQYKDQLLQVSQKGNWDEWISFFLRGVQECACESTEQAEGLLALRTNYHARFQSARSSALLLKLIDELFRTPSITIRRAAAFLDVTDAAASANLKKLVEAGIIAERTGRTRDQRFLATEIVSFIAKSVGEASGGTPPPKGSDPEQKVVEATRS